MEDVSLQLRGMTPKGIGSKGTAWREALLAKAREIRVELPEAPPMFRLEATFYLLPQDEWTLVDLDNLAKPLLDALFMARPRLSDADRKQWPLAADDGRVTELVLRKIVVQNSEEEGVDVHISWKDELDEDPPTPSPAAS